MEMLLEQHVTITVRKSAVFGEGSCLNHMGVNAFFLAKLQF